MSALYVHVPFCVRKCEYCDFYSEAAGERDIERYLDALEREFRLRHESKMAAPRRLGSGGGRGAAKVARGGPQGPRAPSRERRGAGRTNRRETIRSF